MTATGRFVTKFINVSAVYIFILLLGFEILGIKAKILPMNAFTVMFGDCSESFLVRTLRLLLKIPEFLAY